MKKLIIIMLGILSLVSVTFALTETEENTIDRVITRWHARQPEDKLVWRVNDLLNRINAIQARARLTQTWAEVLNYIEARLMRILNAATGTWTTVVTQNPIVYNNAFPSSITIPTQRETKPLLLQWWSATIVAKVDFVVTLEPMIIETVNLYTSNNLLPEYATEMALYDEQWKIVATSTVTSDVISFDNLALEKKPGSHHFYVSLLPWLNDTPTASWPITFTIWSFWLVAKWWITWSKVTKTAALADSILTTVTIAPVAINTLKFVQNQNGYSSNTSLTEWQNILWVIEITTPTNRSRWNRTMLIETITVEVSDTTTARNVASLLQIERLDNSSSTKIYGTVNGNIVTFYLNTNGALSTIEQWQTASYRFVADLDLDSNSRESIELRINNLKNWWITYRDSGVTTPITTIQQWDRQTTSTRLMD